MISSSAMSAAPMPAVSATSGRPEFPPEVSWRTRFEIKFTKTLGFPTLANACLQSSLFKISNFCCRQACHTSLTIVGRNLFFNVLSGLGGVVFEMPIAGTLVDH